MNESIDIRWKQRLDSFQRAHALLNRALSQPQPLSELERMGLIQAFEITFELAWKVMKDYLEYSGFEVNSPRAAIKQAFQSLLITDGQTWLNALDGRNITAHVYDESKAIAVEQTIRNSYAQLLGRFAEKMRYLAHA